jgi:hypothetical protein
VYLLIEKTLQSPIELDWSLQHREMAGLFNDDKRAVRDAFAERR